jgi:hypothetical protein
MLVIVQDMDALSLRAHVVQVPDRGARVGHVQLKYPTSLSFACAPEVIFWFLAFGWRLFMVI